MVIYEGKCIIELFVNGERHSLCVRPADLLVDVLRTQLGLTGTKEGCLNGDCGTCTVIMDEIPVKSCLVLAVESEGQDIVTVEGLGGDTPIQRAFVNTQAFQCGYCTSGFLMACHSLCLKNPDADEYEIERWLESNLCRCTSYGEIGGAVKEALAQTKKINMFK